MAFLPWIVENINLDNTTARSERFIFCYMMVKSSGKHGTIHMFETEKSRANSLKYYKREQKLSDTVFFEFEIPLHLFMRQARKSI